MRLQQVLWNLIGNAIKYSPNGSEVDVSLTAKQNAYLISVADKGEGIEPAFLPFLFDPFRQEEGHTRRRHGGLGLGLSIVRGIVKSHGGQVFVQSAGKNLGAMFTVSVPAKSDSGKAHCPI